MPISKLVGSADIVNVSGKGPKKSQTNSFVVASHPQVVGIVEQKGRLLKLNGAGKKPLTVIA